MILCQARIGGRFPRRYFFWARDGAEADSILEELGAYVVVLMAGLP